VQFLFFAPATDNALKASDRAVANVGGQWRWKELATFEIHTERIFGGVHANNWVHLQYHQASPQQNDSNAFLSLFFEESISG